MSRSHVMTEARLRSEWGLAYLAGAAWVALCVVYAVIS
jgi:hypothetical protein